MQSRVLIAGGSGLTGSRLSYWLREYGYEVSILTRKRNPQSSIQTFEWNPAEGQMDRQALDGVQYIINLAGAGIADKRWTQRRKEEIISSRTRPADTLFEQVRQKPHSLRAVIHASAIGYYPKNENRKWDENAPSGNDFLSRSVVEWEKHTSRFSDLKIRNVICRFGLILSVHGGALKELLRPLAFRIAPCPGNGRQMVSWIHIDDACLAILHAMHTDSMNGIYNFVSPFTVTQKELTNTLGQTTGKLFIPVPVPACILKAAMGKRASLLLDSIDVSARKLLQAGYNFRFNTLKDALSDLLCHHR